jgi:hypothetical protein
VGRPAMRVRVVSTVLVVEWVGILMWNIVVGTW